MIRTENVKGRKWICEFGHLSEVLNHGIRMVELMSKESRPVEDPAMRGRNVFENSYNRNHRRGAIRYPQYFV